MNSNLNNLTPSEAAFAGGLLGAMFIAIVVVYIFIIIAFWRIFTKAGEKGWKSLIPIYNFCVALKIVGMSPWWVLGTFVVTFLQTAVLTGTLGNDADAYFRGDIALPESVAQNIWVILTTILMIVVSLYVTVRFYIRLAKAFKKGTGFTIGLVLFPYIFTLILGFGAAKYDKKILKA